MTSTAARGAIYWCPVCGAEIGVLASQHGEFRPRCCNKPMELLQRRLAFFVCPVCGAEIGFVKEGGGDFRPRCCNTAMLPEAA
jgi:predicted RNA-binding Zn-ribbon protein involved in translation (DUF1610 family)